MKRLSHKPKFGLITAAILLPLSIQAATLDDVVRSVNAVYDLIARTVNATVSSAANLLYETNPSLPQTMANNISQVDANQVNKDRYNAIITNHIKRSVLGDSTPFSITISNINSSKDNKMDLKPSNTLQLANQPASDYFLPGGINVGKLFPGARTSLPGFDAGNINFDANSLTLPTAYDPAQIKNAYNFVQYLARLDQPLMSPKMAWDNLDEKQKLDLQTTKAGQEYKVALRSLIANRSVGLNNLFYLMSQRIPQAGLGSKAGMPQADASPLAVEKFMATRRADDAAWYTNMEKASPATVAREQLHVLAEIEKLLFQMHMDNQRILATLSTMELQNAAQQSLQFKQIERDAAASIGISSDGTPSVEEIGQQFGIKTPPSEEEIEAAKEKQQQDR